MVNWFKPGVHSPPPDHRTELTVVHGSPPYEGDGGSFRRTPNSKIASDDHGYDKLLSFHDTNSSEKGMSGELNDEDNAADQLTSSSSINDKVLNGNSHSSGGVVENASLSGRKLPLQTFGSPPTQVINFSSSSADVSDVDGINSIRIHENEVSGWLSESICEDLAALQIEFEEIPEYLACAPIVPPEVMDKDLFTYVEGNSTVSISLYLWFSIPEMTADNVQLPNLHQDDVLVAETARAVNMWLMICLVRSKILNVIFASRLYFCLSKSQELDYTDLRSIDLTTESRKYWFHKSTDVDVPEAYAFPQARRNSRKIHPGNQMTKLNMKWQRHAAAAHLHLPNIRVESNALEGGSSRYEEALAQQDFCIVYGCAERFDNPSLLQNHLDVGNHVFVCPELECRGYVFKTYGEFINHIEMKHSQHNWKLYRSTEGARLNKMDNLRIPENVVSCKSAVPQKRRKSYPPPMFLGLI